MANRQQMVELVGEAYTPFNRKNLSNAEIKFIIDLYENQLITQLKTGDFVYTSIGKFYVFTSEPKYVRLPRTGEMFRIPEKNRIKFRPNKLIEENVN